MLQEPMLQELMLREPMLQAQKFLLFEHQLASCA